ncbi:MAG: pyridoxamine 5'-phosphate oxidase [Pseudohongiellaceae bacterium]|jgi:pyridoxamine 5'-phosphate oxidase
MQQDPSLTLDQLRREYLRGGLRRRDLPEDPFALFARWLQQAIEAGIADPTAMVLATVAADGQPSQRIVLLKGVDVAGFVFYTNYLSRKGQEIAGSAQVSLLFPWHMLERQVKVTGVAARLDEAASTDYFASRPRDSQLAAWASPQSEPLPSRAALLARLESVKTRFGDGPVPRPPHWGGFRVQPHSIDFWQGGAHRLHDSFRYAREGTGAWQLTRVAP